jgi:hypothetical protein
LSSEVFVEKDFPMKTKHKQMMSGVAALAMAAALVRSALAQPDANNAPKAANPPNQPQGGRPNFRNMTPEQRAEFRFRMMENQLRQFMGFADITDQNTQDEVVLFINSEEKARQPLMDAQRKLMEALAAKAMNQPPVADAAMTTLLTDYRAAIVTEKARHLKAFSDFGVKLGLPLSPRVEAFLSLLGYGDEASTISGGMNGLMGGAMGMGGRGGMMGGPGGMMGGPGGMMGGGPGGGNGNGRGRGRGRGNGGGGGNGGAPAGDPNAPAAAPNA